MKKFYNLRSGINFYHCYGYKNGYQNRMKIGNEDFGTHLKLLTEKLTRAQANTKTDILTDDKNYQGTQQIKSFWYLAVLKATCKSKKKSGA